MKRALIHLMRRKAKSRQPQRHPRSPLAIEPLEARAVPVVGAFSVPLPVARDAGFDGVVRLDVPDQNGNFSPHCTGTLLTTGRHVLTAAHCLTDGNGVIDEPTIRVRFQMADGDVTIDVPQANYRIHPAWNGSVFDGNDVAILELPALAPSGPGRIGAERFSLFRGTNEIGQAFTMVGYGSSGTGTTGNNLPAGVKRRGLNQWTADARLLRNEVQAIMLVGATATTGGNFRLRFGLETTGTIPVNATAAQVQNALVALPNVNPGDVVVRGGPALRTWFVTFGGALANRSVPLLIADDSGLTGFGSIITNTRINGASEAPLTGALAYDFDNGNAVNDPFGMLYGLNGLGLGGTEASQSSGDSGGPGFIAGQIAGVVSYSRPLAPGSPVDIDGVANNSFGEFGVMTRVSSFAGFIDAQTANRPLVLDMKAQVRGNDLLPDTIVVNLVKGTQLTITVNGELYHSEPIAKVPALSIIGSDDRDTIVIANPLGIDVTVDAGGAAPGQTEILSIAGSSAADNVAISSSVVAFGGGTISYANVDRLQVDTLAGNDVVTLLNVVANLQLLGGTESDTLVGPANPNFWDVTAPNSGTLAFLMSFTSFENLRGGPGDDTFVIAPTASISGKVEGGLGRDTLRYVAFTTAITVNLQLGTATATGGIAGIDNLVGGSSAADRLIAANQNNAWNVTGTNAGTVARVANPGPFPVIFSTFSFSAVENLTGGALADTFRMGVEGSVSGTLNGGQAVLIPGGGSGIDTLDFSGRLAGVVVDLLGGRATSTGQALGFENVTGSLGDDLLLGNAGPNVLSGSGGFDVLVGGDGNDRLISGNTGRSVLIGGRGQDVIVGGDVSGGQFPVRSSSDGSDLLIAGDTDFDRDTRALTAIMAEWRRTDRTYEKRVQVLRDGVPVATGGVAQLTPLTVRDDGVVDQLAGKTGDDWFWGNKKEVTDLSELRSTPGVMESVN